MWNGKKWFAKLVKQEVLLKVGADWQPLDKVWGEAELRSAPREGTVKPNMNLSDSLKRKMLFKK